MRLSFIEALCLVAIGATMVELHDTRRFARPSTPDATALATAAKPAAGAGEARSTEPASGIPNAGHR